VKLPNPFRCSEQPRRGSHVARGSVSYRGDGLADRLRALGVVVHDPLADAHRAGRFGRLQRAGGAASHPGVTDDELPPGAKVTRAKPVTPRLGGDDGTTWNGQPEGR
jgi:hypothetical protein